MKKVFSMGLMLMGLATLFSFTTEDSKFEGLLPSYYASEYISTFNNTTLLEEVALAVATDFETVERIDLHYNQDIQSYYYAVYGTADCLATVSMYKVSDKEAATETFSFYACQCGYCLENRLGQCNITNTFGIQCGCIDCSMGWCNIF